LGPGFPTASLLFPSSVSLLDFGPLTPSRRAWFGLRMAGFARRVPSLGAIPGPALPVTLFRMPFLLVVHRPQSRPPHCPVVSPHTPPQFPVLGPDLLCVLVA
jgi:hypothetical protein